VQELKVATLCSLITAFVFSIFSIVFYYGDWDRLLVVSLLGFFLGLIAAPELDPKAFKRACLFQLLSGMVSGGVIGWILCPDQICILIAIVAGGLLGWTAPFWLKLIPIP